MFSTNDSGKSVLTSLSFALKSVSVLDWSCSSMTNLARSSIIYLSMIAYFLCNFGDEEKKSEIVEVIISLHFLAIFKSCEIS